MKCMWRDVLSLLKQWFPRFLCPSAFCDLIKMDFFSIDLIFLHRFEFVPFFPERTEPLSRSFCSRSLPTTFAGSLRAATAVTVTTQRQCLLTNNETELSSVRSAFHPCFFQWGQGAWLSVDFLCNYSFKAIEFFRPLVWFVALRQKLGGSQCRAARDWSTTESDSIPQP